MHLDWFNFLNMDYVAQTSMLTASVLLAILNVASEYVYKFSPKSDIPGQKLRFATSLAVNCGHMTKF